MSIGRLHKRSAIFCAFCQKILPYRPIKMRKIFSIWWVSKCEFLAPYGGIFPVYVIFSTGIFWKWLSGRVFHPEFGNFSRVKFFHFFTSFPYYFVLYHKIVILSISEFCTNFSPCFCAIFLGITSMVENSHFWKIFSVMEKTGNFPTAGRDYQ